jgi:hypothetical protein
MGIREFLGRFKLSSVQAGYGDDHDREVDNIDALAAAAQSQRSTPTGGPALFPPDYVKADDEGRPPH